MTGRIRSRLADTLWGPGSRARQLSLSEPLERRPADVPGSLLRIRPHPDGCGIEAAASFFRSLHDVRTNYRGVNTSEHGTFELWFDDGWLGIYLHTRDGTINDARRRLATTFDYAEVDHVTDGRAFPAVDPDEFVAAARVQPRRHHYYPIRTHAEEGFSPDPYARLTGAMSTRADCSVVVQVCFRPAKRSWTDPSLFRQDGVEDVAHGLRQGISVGWLNPRIRPAAETDEHHAERLVRQRGQVAYHTIIRVLAVSPDPKEAATRARIVAGTFRQQYDGLAGQGLIDVRVSRRSSWLERRRLRQFLERMADRRWGDTSTILTVDELAGVAHLPPPNARTPAIDWCQSSEGDDISPDGTESSEEELRR